MITPCPSSRGLAVVLMFGCLLAPGALAQRVPTFGKRPVDYANGLVGTAPLDDRKLIGNAPPDLLRQVRCCLTAQQNWRPSMQILT